MPKLEELPAVELSSRIRRGEIKAEEYVHKVLDRIRKVERKIHAYITVMDEEALKKAGEIDRKVRSGSNVGRLCGVAVAVKDNLCTEGVRTTCCSRMLENFIPPYDAAVVERIRQEDAVLVGKTNMDEFAMGSSTEYSYFKPTRNPWNLDRVPGGSSGGSAAAVAAGEAALALGSDTGGSIRCPASFCSVVGLKPTYGLVSRYGLVAYANSLEQIGPFAESVEDCALLLSCVAGHDPNDSTSLNKPKEDYVSFLQNDVRGLRIGVPKQFFGDGTDRTVDRAVWNAVKRLEQLGATYEEISLKSLDYALAAYYIVAMSEASSNLARYDGLRYGLRKPDRSRDWSAAFSENRSAGFGAEVKRRIILGTYALSAGYYSQYYLKAQQIRTLIRRDFDEAFKRFDVVAGPTMPILPFKIGEKIRDPLEMYMCDVDTVPANLAGLPALSVPCGFHNGLPIGLQLMAAPSREDLLLRVGYTYEQNMKHSFLKPKI